MYHLESGTLPVMPVIRKTSLICRQIVLHMFVSEPHAEFDVSLCRLYHFDSLEQQERSQNSQFSPP